MIDDMRDGTVAGLDWQAAVEAAAPGSALLLTARWSAAEPERGGFDAAQRDRWRAALVAARRRRVEPLICLHDGALPGWQLERGGWLDPDVLSAWGCWVDWLARGTAELVRYWFSFHGLLREAAWSLRRAPEVARLLIDAHAHARLLLHRSPGFQGRACEVGVIEHFAGPTDPMNRAQALTLLRVLATGRLERPFALTGELPNGTPALDRVGFHWRGSAQADVAATVRAVWAVRCPLTLIGVGRTEAEAAESAGVRTDHRLSLAPGRATLW